MYFQVSSNVSWKNKKHNLVPNFYYCWRVQNFQTNPVVKVLFPSSLVIDGNPDTIPMRKKLMKS